jgi:hypothetical protein
LNDLARARELVADFKAAGYDAGAVTLQTQLEWCEKGTIDAEEMARALKLARDEFLAWQRAKMGKEAGPDART